MLLAGDEFWGPCAPSAYFSVDWHIVWNTATDAVPTLAAQVAYMLTYA